MRTLLFAVAVLAVTCGVASDAGATIGWAGNVWPLHGAAVVPTGPVSVYAQVWKGGTTDLPGQGADITAELRYTTDIAPMATVAMVFNTDVGSNDEYTAQVPQAALVGATYVDVTVVFTDLTDASTFEVVGDQQNNPPPLRYNVVDVIPVDIAVTFTMCMSGTPTNGAPCVIGSAPEIGTWGTGVTMTNIGGELWQVTVVFLAGGNPNFEYKYKADGCTNWEFVGNRFVTLPTDGTTAVNLATDSFNNAPLGCAQGDQLDADKTVCFQVCVEGVQNTGAVCVTGGHALLTNWGAGVPMVHLGGGLYQACLTFPAGSPAPLPVEFKFKKDDCQTWEGVGNRSVTLTDASPSEQTVTYGFDDTPGMCQPIPVDGESWGSIKARFE